MEDPIEMKPKGLFKVHPKLSKKSKITPLRVKIEGDMHCESWPFLKNCQKSTISKIASFVKWA